MAIGFSRTFRGLNPSDSGLNPGPVTNVCLGKLVHHGQKVNSDPFLKPRTKKRWKWINNMDIRPESTKFIEENMHGRLHGSEARDINDSKLLAKETNEQMSLYQIRTFCITNVTMARIRIHPMAWDRIFCLPLMGQKVNQYLRYIKR